MKSEAEVDAIMAAMPENCRTHWCNRGEAACACIGCVEIGNRAVIIEKITGVKFTGDPERIDEGKLREHGEVYTSNKVEREEWQCWMRRTEGPE